MPTADRTFTFASSLEGWVAVPQSGVAMTRVTTDGHSDGACIQSRVTGKNNNVGTSWWEWTGTWEDLGVPPGSVVTEANGVGSYFGRCSEYVTGTGTNAAGPFEIWNAAGTVLIGTLSAIALDYTGTTGWQQAPSTAVSIPDHPSDTTIRLRLSVTMRTGNSASAVVAIRQDSIHVETTFTADEGEELSVAGTLPDLAGAFSVAAAAEVDVAGALPGLDGSFTLEDQAVGFDPANAQVTINGSTGELTWDASPTPGVVDYQVFRRTPQTGDPFDPEVDTPVATGITDLFYDDVGLDPGDFDWQVFGRVPA